MPIALLSDYIQSLELNLLRNVYALDLFKAITSVLEVMLSI